MNKVEVNEIAGTLTQPQRDVLVMLDGRLSNLELPGVYGRVLTSLTDKGLVVTMKRRKRTAPDVAHNVYMVQLTDRGGDFIYNGGIDR